MRLLSPGPPDQDIADAREALRFWHGRSDGLAWHRRAARREARDHIARWHEHLEAAQLRRFGIERSHPLAPLIGALALPRREQARRVGALLMRTGPVRRVWRLMVAVALVTAVVLVLAAASAAHLL